MKSKKNKSKKPETRLQEPGSSSVKAEKPEDPWKTITVSSLKEQEEAMRLYSAGLSHLECMEILQKLIRISFGQQFKQPVDKLWNKEIHITKYG
jgi:hypothetical protein